MVSRAPKLHEASTLIVWGSRILTISEAALWHHTWRLDTAWNDGCYLSPTSFSARLGGKISPYTVEEYRANLHELGLLEAFRRPDGRNMGWVATLPAVCTPLKKWERHIEEIAAQQILLLDTYLEQHPERLARTAKPPDYRPIRNRGAPRSPIGSQPDPQSGRNPAQAAALEGGRGEEGSSSQPVVQSKAQLPPAVRDPEGGTGVEVRSARARARNDPEGPSHVSDVLGDVLASIPRSKGAAS